MYVDTNGIYSTTKIGKMIHTHEVGANNSESVLQPPFHSNCSLCKGLKCLLMASVHTGKSSVEGLLTWPLMPVYRCDVACAKQYLL